MKLNGYGAVALVAALSVAGWLFLSVQGLQVRVAVNEQRFAQIVSTLEKLEVLIRDENR